MREKIGIDHDECQNEFIFGFLYFHNQMYKTHLQMSDFVSYNFWEIIGCDKHESIKRVHEFYASPFFLNLPVAPYSREVIQQLSVDYDLFVVTSRPEVTRDKTEKWLSQHFLDRFRGIIFTNEWSLHGNGKNKSKGDLCRELGISYVIEDNVDYANECAEKGITTLLLDKPWNRRQIPSERVYRVNGWHDILNFFQGEKCSTD